MRSYRNNSGAKSHRRGVIIKTVAVILLLIAGFFVFKAFYPSEEEKVANNLSFDSSVTAEEQQKISDSIVAQQISVSAEVNTSITTTLEAGNTAQTTEVYVPVTNVYASTQGITEADLAGQSIYMPEGTNEAVKSAVASALGIDQQSILALTKEPADLSPGQIALVPVSSLDYRSKLLSLEGKYYLDNFNSGAVFRQANFAGDGAESVASLSLNSFASKDSTLKINATGVTALTRLMMRKLNSVSDPLYFSQEIGDFMADADITHISNEVSFQEGCQYSNTSFCSPPEFIETLKASGVDLVEITGNHNNDRGSTYNTETINLYHSLGWSTFGGGLNEAEAAKPHVADQKGSKLAFLGYNMADGQGSGAIAGSTTAGANFYTDAQAQSDIEAAKQNSDFVIVHIQYAECQAYPSGYTEYPICDSPIPGQTEDFKRMIDYGADMVIGSSAHQPQTYELYKDKFIFYGLGNMYFDQYQWPGTERGIIVSSYFADGKLLQSRLTPTVYDTDLQTMLMNAEETEYLLDRLNDAR